MKRKIIYLIFIVLLANPLLFDIKAQDNTMYYMHSLPQSIAINPAVQPKFNGFVLIPTLSSVRFGLYNNSFTFDDLIRQGSGLQADSLVFDLDNIESKLTEYNYVRNCIDINILGGGFKYNNMYFTLTITNRTEFRFSFPKDIISIKDGNFNNETGKAVTRDLSNLGVNINNYNEIAVSASRTFLKDKLTIGTRLKYLKGSINLSTAQSKIKLITQGNDNPVESLIVDTDFRMNTTYPLNVTYDEDGTVSKVEDAEDIDVASLTYSSKNNGFGMDVGATYEYNKEITFSASIVDLGIIRWKNNVHNFKSQGEFAYEGVDISPNGEDDTDEDFFDELTDSLENMFDVNDPQEAYNTFLPTKIYLGALYQYSQKISFGAVMKSVVFDKRLHPSLTLSANVRPTNWFSGCLTYSMMNRSYGNIGTGIVLRGGPMQFYFVCDNILAPVIPKKFKTVTLHFGFNLVFGHTPEYDDAMIEDI